MYTSDVLQPLNWHNDVLKYILQNDINVINTIRKHYSSFHFH